MTAKPVRIKQLTDHNIHQALDLAWEEFAKTVAKDYTTDGIQEFHNYLMDTHSMKKLKFYGMVAGEYDDEMLGMMATSKYGSHISLLFVRSNYTKTGVGTALINHLVNKSYVGKLEVHAAPSAVGFYKNAGFKETDAERVENGIRYTPMELLINRKD